MGKHNGKARSTGAKVGGALVNRSPGMDAHKRGPVHGKHTTEAGEMSVVQPSDLAEIMQMANLANQSFAGEREQSVVVAGPAAVQAAAATPAPESFSESDLRVAMAIPRRPRWTQRTTADQLHEQERAAFLEWRREKAELEKSGLYLTPFEKNLEVWKQLWRVVERSDILVQVVDARDPLLYWSSDLMAFAKEVCPTKQTYMLINKADLLPPENRRVWHEYLTAKGVPHFFWSAMAASQELAAVQLAGGSRKMQMAVVAEQRRREAGLVAAPPVDPDSLDTLGVDGLIEALTGAARGAVEAAPEGDARRGDADRRLVVGLVGYPNVGKSSTINTLFGSKKAAVAPTPGKTKHFQTLNINDRLTFVDCPGLVFPQIARSRAEMVAAGVIPIDQLMDVRIPVDLVAHRLSRGQFKAVYDIDLKPPSNKEKLNPLWAADALLAAFAKSRGWMTGSGLPDKTRAGRHIMKDYVAGRLLYAKWPQGMAPGEGTGSSKQVEDATAGDTERNEGEARASQSGQEASASTQADAGVDDSWGGGEGAAIDDEELLTTVMRDAPGPMKAGGRPAHKYHKKKKGLKTFVATSGISGGQMWSASGRNNTA